MSRTMRTRAICRRRHTFLRESERTSGCGAVRRSVTVLNAGRGERTLLALRGDRTFKCICIYARGWDGSRVREFSARFGEYIGGLKGIFAIDIGQKRLFFLRCSESCVDLYFIYSYFRIMI